MSAPPTPKDVEKYSKVELPPEIVKMFHTVRGQFFSEVGPCYENSLKGVEMVMKGLVATLTELHEENLKLKAQLKPAEKPPNRAARRKAAKKAK